MATRIEVARRVETAFRRRDVARVPLLRDNRHDSGHLFGAICPECPVAAAIIMPLVEAIIALPTDMFFNTGISTYVWVLSNRKPTARRGLVQLIDASALWQKMRRSLGSKRKEMSEAQIDLVTRSFGAAAEARLATLTDTEGRATIAVVADGTAPWPRSMPT